MCEGEQGSTIIAIKAIWEVEALVEATPISQPGVCWGVGVRVCV